MNKNEIMTPQEILKKYPEINRVFDEHDHGRLEIIQAMEEYHQAMQQKQTGEAMSADKWVDKYGALCLDMSDMMELYAAYRLQQAQNVDWEALKKEYNEELFSNSTERFNWFCSKLSGCSAGSKTSNP
jgi:hypothetical protein